MGVHKHYGQIAPISATLPASPTDGQEVLYTADATNGILWHLRYRAAAAGTFKWEFIGGSEFITEQSDTGTVTSTSYVGVGTNLQITVPLAGDYKVTWSVLAQGSVATALFQMGIKRGSAATVDADALMLQPPGPNYMGAGMPVRPKRFNGLAAGTVLKAEYKINTGSLTIFDRWLTVVPIRVG